MVGDLWMDFGWRLSSTFPAILSPVAGTLQETLPPARPRFSDPVYWRASAGTGCGSGERPKRTEAAVNAGTWQRAVRRVRELDRTHSADCVLCVRSPPPPHFTVNLRVREVGRTLHPSGRMLAAPWSRFVGGRGLSRELVLGALLCPARNANPNALVRCRMRPSSRTPLWGGWN
jgi:hypothetical protein